MGQRVVIVGAGVIGAACAFRLAEQGHAVTVIDGGGGQATAASFGWLNASFYLDEAHFALRAEGLRAWRRLEDRVTLPVSWCGALSWEAGPDELDRQRRALEDLGYPVEAVGPERFAELEPAVAARPELALLFPSEGAAESATATHALIGAAEALGARVIRGVQVEGLACRGDSVVGVETTAGRIPADEVLVAAGTGSEAILATAGHHVPLLPRPALILTTRPVAPVLSRVLVTSAGEVRQLPSGRLLMPTTVGHQGDSATEVVVTPAEGADAALHRLRALLPDLGLDWSEVTLAWRPYPGDGRPAMGRLGEGLSLAVMHSGMTLAALVGEVMADVVAGRLSNEAAALVAPYDPARFRDALSDTKTGAG